MEICIFKIKYVIGLFFIDNSVYTYMYNKNKHSYNTNIL